MTALFDLPDAAPKSHACGGMVCQVCHTAADDKRDRKIAQGQRHADLLWLEMAERYMRANAREGVEFTTDEVMDWLTVNRFDTHDPRALGGVVRKLRKEGVLIPIGYTTSRRRHSAPIPVYRGVRT